MGKQESDQKSNRPDVADLTNVTANALAMIKVLLPHAAENDHGTNQIGKQCCHNVHLLLKQCRGKGMIPSEPVELTTCNVNHPCKRKNHSANMVIFRRRITTVWKPDLFHACFTPLFFAWLVSILVRLTVVSFCFGIMLIILCQFEKGSDLFKWSTVNETLEELKKKCGLLWPFTR